MVIVVLNEHMLAETEPNQICGTINKKCGDCGAKRHRKPELQEFINGGIP